MTPLCIPGISYFIYIVNYFIQYLKTFSPLWNLPGCENQSDKRKILEDICCKCDICQRLFVLPVLFEISPSKEEDFVLGDEGSTDLVLLDNCSVSPVVDTISRSLAAHYRIGLTKHLVCYSKEYGKIKHPAGFWFPLVVQNILEGIIFQHSRL